MSGFAGTLDQRVTMLTQDPARDDLGGAAGVWRDGPTIWAAVRPDGTGAGDDAGVRRRWIVTVRSAVSTVLVERLRWQGRVLAVRRVEPDPAMPDRHALRTEELR